MKGRSLFGELQAEAEMYAILEGWRPSSQSLCVSTASIYPQTIVKPAVCVVQGASVYFLAL